jgi:hypothetical protein
MNLTIKGLNQRQFDYLGEVLDGCVNDTIKETADFKEDEVNDGVSSLTHKDAVDLYKKLSEIFFFVCEE